MGVDYFNCDFCGEPTSDCSFCTFEVINLSDDLCVCDDCGDLLKKNHLTVYREEPDWGYLTKNLETNEIKYYDDWKTFKKTISEIELKKNFKYGFWKVHPEYLQKRLKEALLGSNNYGGMTETDVKEACDKNQYNRNKTFYIGFRNLTDD